jgi:hypothetical protein
MKKKKNLVMMMCLINLEKFLLTKRLWTKHIPISSIKIMMNNSSRTLEINLNMILILIWLVIKIRKRTKRKRGARRTRRTNRRRWKIKIKVQAQIERITRFEEEEGQQTSSKSFVSYQKSRVETMDTTILLISSLLWRDPQDINPNLFHLNQESLSLCQITE